MGEWIGRLSAMSEERSKQQLCYQAETSLCKDAGNSKVNGANVFMFSVIFTPTPPATAAVLGSYLSFLYS
jgi:hypothetical protein